MFMQSFPTNLTFKVDFSFLTALYIHISQTTVLKYNSFILLVKRVFLQGLHSDWFVFTSEEDLSALFTWP